jgi:hypothetical protein
MDHAKPRAAARVDLATPRVAVAVVSDRPLSDEEWADYVETTSALGDANHRTVVFTAGGGPTTLQQHDLAATDTNQRDVKLAIIHGGAGTVSRWWRDPGTRAFTPDQLDEAFRFLELSSHERARVIRLARRLARELELANRFAWRPSGRAAPAQA